MARSPGISQAACDALLAAYARTGVIAKAAKEVGVHRSTAREYIRGNFKPAPDKDMGTQATIESLRRELDTTRQALKDAVRPRYTIRADNISRGDRVRVVVIGDAHDSPLLDKSRFEWLGKYVADTKPDFVVQIGDIASFDSVSSHANNLENKTKPRIIDDINSLSLALDAFNSGLGSYNVPKHITLGNHEKRLFTYEGENPEVEGMPSHMLDVCLKDRGWTYSPFAQEYFIGGVAFLHCALNRMGRPIGGQTSENITSNSSLNDCVLGHSHVKRVVRYPKLFGKHLTIVNAGCALPQGHVESYARHSLTGWWFGCGLLTIKDNHIINDEWVSMETLGERYA
jgi:hypothetical protein